MEGIVILDSPVEADYGEWLAHHPECDTIVDPIGNNPKIYVYAYAMSYEYNKALETLQRKNYKGKHILGGMTREAAARIR